MTKRAYANATKVTKIDHAKESDITIPLTSDLAKSSEVNKEM